MGGGVKGTVSQVSEHLGSNTCPSLRIPLSEMRSKRSYFLLLRTVVRHE